MTERQKQCAPDLRSRGHNKQILLIHVHVIQNRNTGMQVTFDILIICLPNTSNFIHVHSNTPKHLIVDCNPSCTCHLSPGFSHMVQQSFTDQIINYYLLLCHFIQPRNPHKERRTYITQLHNNIQHCTGSKIRHSNIQVMSWICLKPGETPK